MNYRLAALLTCIPITTIATGMKIPKLIITVINRMQLNEKLLQSMSNWTGVVAAVFGAVAAIAGLLYWVFSTWLSDLKDVKAKTSEAESEKVISSLQKDLKSARLGVDDLRKKQGDRRIDEKLLVEALKDKPKMKVEVVYQPDDRDSYHIARTIVTWLGKGENNNGAGWEVTGPRPFNTSDILPDLPDSTNNEPMALRVGAIMGSAMVISQSLNNRLPLGCDMVSSNPVGALSVAMIAAGFWIHTVAPDPRLADDTIKLIITAKE